jgi:hypothetical protein
MLQLRGECEPDRQITQTRGSERPSLFIDSIQRRAGEFHVPVITDSPVFGAAFPSPDPTLLQAKFCGLVHAIVVQEGQGAPPRITQSRHCPISAATTFS